ncbi:MAG: hypothetical protein A2057_03270 [Ignavibacteria bacterium GWA2_35_9]|nr:MAG: hypothetical protein A2057_03270 [Ignavibacteria bacterium GWA2_35_9]OGU94262.1 MAG: hypothetical protein A2330_04105 [Ignavibacteria bacterium RIFOXYB2_FULL_36_7]
MRLIFLLNIFFVLSKLSFAQFDLSASMGINFVNSPSFSDYISQTYAPPGETVEGFIAAVVFSGEAGYRLSESYEAAIDVGYLINSYTSTLSYGQYNIDYGNLMFSLLNYYVLHGDGYNFKFGAGAGLRLLSADESLPGTGITKTYSSTGYGFILRAEGNTLLGGNIYAKIAAQAGYDINGEPENDGTYLYNNVNKEKVNFNSLSVGLSLGVSYIF